MYQAANLGQMRKKKHALQGNNSLFTKRNARR